MHRVDSKQNKRLALRVVAYIVTLTLTTLTTIVLLYAALGYRFDLNGHVTRNGLLLVDTKPEAASVYINGEQKDASAPSRFVLSAGTYDLKLKRSSYREWSKRVSVTASGVREVTYPIMIPQKLKTRSLIDVESQELVSQSQDRKLVLMHSANSSEMTLLTLDPKQPKQTNLQLPSTLRLEAGQAGSFKVIEWALNNKKVLIQQTLPSGAVELLSLDVTKPDELVNITALYGAAAPSDIHYVGGDTDYVYGVKDGVLSKYNLNEAGSTVLLQNVRSYRPYSDDTILFDRVNGEASEIGLWKDKVSTVIQKGVVADAPSLLRYASFQDHFYFVVTNPNSASITIYRDPLKKPILANQLPLKRLTFERPQQIDFSDSSQFILAQNGSAYIVYDLDDLLTYTGVLTYELAPNTTLDWVGGEHILAQSKDGTNHLFEYDGQNAQQLVVSESGLPLLFAGNSQHTYQLNQNENAKFKLSVTSLVAGKD